MFSVSSILDFGQISIFPQSDQFEGSFVTSDVDSDTINDILIIFRFVNTQYIAKCYCSITGSL